MLKIVFENGVKYLNLSKQGPLMGMCVCGMKSNLMLVGL